MKYSYQPALALLLMAFICWPAAAAQPLADRLQRPSPVSAQPARSVLTALQAFDSNLVMVGESGCILLRDHAGQLQQANVPVDVLLTAVFFPDTHNGWAVGHDGVILHSNDSGQNWRKQLDGHTINELMVKAAAAEVGQAEQADAAAPEALDNANFFLDDVTAGAQNGASRPLLDVWFRDSQNGWAAGAYGTLLRTRDGGQTWAYVPGLDNPERLHLNSVLGLADGSVVVAGEGGRVYRSLDDGAHWLAAQVLTNASLYKLLPLRDGRLLVLGFGGTLYVSNDHGQGWEKLVVPVAASLYAGTQLRDGSVWLSGQGGALLHADADLHFSPRPVTTKAPLMGVSELPNGELAVISPIGFTAIPASNTQEMQP
jgi:photosystem II stability/assembly factor-like uncharacterized protein